MMHLGRLEPIATLPPDIPAGGQQCLVWGRVWAHLDDEGRERIELWEQPRFYLIEWVKAGIVTVNPSFVTGELTECRGEYWCPLPAPQ